MTSAQLASVLWRVAAAALLLMLLWLLREPLLILFGAVLLAATLRAVADPLQRFTPLSSTVAVTVVTACALLLMISAIWLLGNPLAEQLQALRSEVPKAWNVLQQWLATQPAGGRVLALLQQVRQRPLPWQNIASVAASTLTGLTMLVLIVLTGLYIAFDVATYRNGVVRLFPRAHRMRVGEALDAAGQALKRWVIGQAVTMVLVGAAVAAGLALLGMPMALALGTIAGLLEFIPFLGPIVAGALAVLVAFVQGPEQALYVALLFTVIQQLEGNLLVPMVQRWAVQLPPALVVTSVLMFGTLFGLTGVVLATPLAVISMVLVQRLYVQDTLEQASA